MLFTVQLDGLLPSVQRRYQPGDVRPLRAATNQSHECLTLHCRQVIPTTSECLVQHILTDVSSLTADITAVVVCRILVFAAVGCISTSFIASLRVTDSYAEI